MNRRCTTLVVSAPLVAVATLMLGLRVGAGESVRAASIFAAPAGRAPAGGGVPLAWQILTYLEDRGVRETVPMNDLTLVARSEGKESRWTGASNADGIAEASLAFEGLLPGDAVDVVLTNGAASLAEGTILVPPRASRPEASEGAVRFSKREGAIGLDVVVEGERLVPGFATTVWVHTSSAGATPNLAIDPEAGLLVQTELPVACGSWAELSLVAQSHVVGMRIDATIPGGDAKGVWFGALPVAPGAFHVGLPRHIASGEASTAVLSAPNPRTVVYAEVDDEDGRVLAAALPIVADPAERTPRANLVLPPLAPGLHWLVASGEPRGAEHLAGAAIARPFLVGEPASAVDATRACSLGPWLARHPAPGFPRSLALDGMATRGAQNRRNYGIGLAIGLGSLLVAALLEVLLLTSAAREARAALLLASLDDETSVSAAPPGGNLLVALLVALLGFALLASLLFVKA